MFLNKYFAFLYFCPFVLFSQGIEIKGKIIDANNEFALYGATVYVDGNLDKGAVTDSLGRFNLIVEASDLKKRLVVSHIGYEKKYVSISAKNTQFVIRLKPNSTELSDVVISADGLIAEEFRVEKIEQLDIYRNPIAKADPILAVNSLAFSTTTDETANVSLRGSSPDESAIFLNSVPVYDAVKFAQLDGIGAFSIFTTSIIEKIEIFPSNPPLEYGGSSSGIIALTTIDEKLPANELHSITASLIGLSYNINKTLSKDNHINVFSNFQHSHLFKKVNPVALSDLTNFANGDAGVFLSLKTGKRSRMTIYNYSLLEGYNFRQPHPSTTLLFDQERKRNFTVANLKWKLKTSELSLNLGYNVSASNFVGGNLSIQTDNEDIYFSINHKMPFNKYILKVGASMDARRQEYLGFVPLFTYALDATHPVENIDFNEEINNLELYQYSKYVFSEKLIAGIGLRKNIPLDDQQSYWSYQSNLNYHLSNKVGFIFSFGKYNKYEFDGFDNELRGWLRSSQAALDARFESKTLTILSGVYFKKGQSDNLNNEIFGFDTSLTKKIRKKIVLKFSIASVNATVEDMDGVRYSSIYDLDFFFRSGLTYTSDFFPFH